MRFSPPLWHPNVHSDGKVCISILHAPGEDKYGYEKSCERWSPVQSVEKILIRCVRFMKQMVARLPKRTRHPPTWQRVPALSAPLERL